MSTACWVRREEERRRNLSDFLVISVLMGLFRKDPLQKEKEKKKI